MSRPVLVEAPMLPDLFEARASEQGLAQAVDYFILECVLYLARYDQVGNPRPIQHDLTETELIAFLRQQALLSNEYLHLPFFLERLQSLAKAEKVEITPSPSDQAKKVVKLREV